MRRAAIIVLLLLVIMNMKCSKARRYDCTSKRGTCVKNTTGKCDKIRAFCPYGRTCCRKDKKPDKRPDKKPGREPDKARCKMKPSCRVRGGECLRTDKTTADKGKFIDKGCTSRKCRCYIPRDTCSCGKVNNSSRVIGGQEVSPVNKYPWLVGLRTKSVRFINCGGTIINNLYVVTAAHCIQSSGKLMDTDEIVVSIADHDYSSIEDDIPGVTQKALVDELIVHPEYKHKLPHHDIGLIRLKKALDLSDQVFPACLPTIRGKSYVNHMGLALGWGAIDTVSFQGSKVPREVSLPILNKNCNGIRVSDVEITKNMLCAGGKVGEDTCSGDSGGPLTVREGGKHTLVGITSFGKGCAKKDMPAVYTRVSQYVKWITKITKDASYCS